MPRRVTIGLIQCSAPTSDPAAPIAAVKEAAIARHLPFIEDAARRFQSEVEVGMIGINVPIPVPAAYYSFGGWKQSLFGDAHMHGREGIMFYTRGKVVTTRWPDPMHRGVNLGFPQMK